MKRLALAILLLAGPASAQTATPNEQALLAKITSEMNAGLQCTSALISATQAMEKATARIKELEDKYEPKKVETPPAKK